MTVAVIMATGNRRSEIVCQAMGDGLRRIGENVAHINEEFYHGPDHAAAVHYGLRGKCRQAFDDYRRIGRPGVYIDLGYWGRIEGGKLYGFHKFAVNARHPTEYFQNVRHPPDRFRHFHLAIKPWNKDGRNILVAGMGAKAAAYEGYLPNQWEKMAIDILRQHTERPIIYRPKPSWRHPEGIMGTVNSGPDQHIQDVLQDCFAVVSHHSNVCVDALIEGVPVFCVEGVASVMGLSDLSKIETPIYPDDREQFCCNVAYQQWTVSEMRIGTPWRHLRSMGLVP